MNYEYEMFFDSQPDEPIQIKGWYPIATDRIRHPEKIQEYIEKGLLRKIDFRIKEDNICPITKTLCDDECCPVGAVCNLSGPQEIQDIDPSTDHRYQRETIKELLSLIDTWRIVGGEGSLVDLIQEHFTVLQKSPIPEKYKIFN